MGFFRSEDALQCGPGRATLGPGSRSGAPISDGERLQGLPTTGVWGLRPHCLHPSGRFGCCVCVWVCVCVCAPLVADAGGVPLQGPSSELRLDNVGPRLSRSPPPASATRRLGAAHWEPCGAARLMLRRAPALFLLGAVCWPGQRPGRRLRRQPEPPGMSKRCTPCGLVRSSLARSTRGLRCTTTGPPLSRVLGCRPSSALSRTCVSSPSAFC
jgi:hypothetical protein